MPERAPEPIVRTTGGTMEERLPVIFIVEDNADTVEAYTEVLRGSAVVVAATTVPEAEAVIASGIPFAAVLMDGCLTGHELETEPLVRLLRDGGFPGPVIATSSRSEFQERLLAAGCDHACDKGDAWKLALELLRG